MTGRPSSFDREALLDCAHGRLFDIRRVISRRLVMGIGEGRLLADGRPIYQTEDLRVGLFNLRDPV